MNLFSCNLHKTTKRKINWNRQFWKDTRSGMFRFGLGSMTRWLKFGAPGSHNKTIRQVRFVA